MASSYTLGSHFETFVSDLVASGRYSTASEVMRDGLRLLEEREDTRKQKLAALRAAISAGAQSGEGMDADTVLDRLDAKYAMRA
jgi:antitoxin ParD1/3/4